MAAGFTTDKVWPHAARDCRDFLANNNIVPLNWPPNSPDLSPVEYLWDDLDRRVKKRQNPPTTLAQLRNALEEAHEILITAVNIHFRLCGVPTNELV